jgi:hypothetical protein
MLTKTPPSDMDMEDDAEILATLLKHIPSCMNADDIEQLLQAIPVQPRMKSTTTCTSA